MVGTSCLCTSILYRFPLNYPYCTVSYCHKQQPPPTTKCVSSNIKVCQQKQTCLSVKQRQQHTQHDHTSELRGGWGVRRPYSMQNPVTAAILAAAAAACVMIIAVSGAEAAETQQEINGETLSNIPQLLSGECVDGNKDCKKARIQRPKSRKAETCTVKCVNTCIRGGLGSPGEGPLNVRRPLVVFKQGFRSRQYCLVECSDICNLIRDGEDGP